MHFLSYLVYGEENWSQLRIVHIESSTVKQIYFAEIWKWYNVLMAFTPEAPVQIFQKDS